MHELKGRFRALDRIPAPDLWRRIQRRRPADLPLGRSWRRVAVAGLAVAVAGAGVTVAVRAFVGGNATRVVLTPPPVTRGANGEIAFVRGASGSHPTIYVMRPDGTGLKRLTTGGGSSFDPVWSPDGTRIAFVAATPSNIYVMNADGSNVARISSCDRACVDVEPAWSPDGRRIAFVRRGDIYVMNADGSGVRRVIHAETPLGDGQPAWSPDGARIAFIALREPPSQVPAIYVVNSDGTNLRKLTRCGPETCVDSEPTWSPGGTHIAFLRARDIYVMSDSGTGVKVLIGCDRIPGCVSLGEPEWSPDETQIAFTVERSDGSRQLFTMALQTGKVSRLIASRTDDCCPSWQALPVA